MEASCSVLQSLEVGEYLEVGLVVQCVEGSWRDQIFVEGVLSEKLEGIEEGVP